MPNASCRHLPLILLVFFSAGWASAQRWHTVKWVNDGDTIVLTNGQRVRYIGINAPEIDHENQKTQPYGFKAKSFNKKLVLSQKIRLEFDTERYDRYGRLLAYIFLADGSFLNALVLQNGYAFYLYQMPNVQHSELLLKAQQGAMKAKKGIWRNWREDNAVYIANRNSRRFHLATCPLAHNIKGENKIKFFKKWDAFEAGYAPARECIREFWNYECKDEKQLKWKMPNVP